MAKAEVFMNNGDTVLFGLVNRYGKRYPNLRYIDREDFERYIRDDDGWYFVQRRKGNTKYLKKYDVETKKDIFLHRLLAFGRNGAHLDGSLKRESVVTDHVNGCGYDNRSGNIEIVSLAENTRRAQSLKKFRSSNN